MPPSSDIVKILEELDKMYPEDVYIASGLRSPEEQEKEREGSGYGTNGAKISEHVKGRGADVYIPNHSANSVADEARRLGARGTATYDYNNITHIDTRSGLEWHRRDLPRGGF